MNQEAVTNLNQKNKLEMNTKQRSSETQLTTSTGLLVRFDEIAIKSEVSIENVKIILHQESLRTLDKEVAVKKFMVAVKLLEETYSFAPVEKVAFIELMKMLKESYAWISAEEVLLAFRLAASGQLNSSVKMYDGVFNLGKVGEILNAYKIYRVRVISASQHFEAIAKKQAERDKLLSPAGQQRVNDHIWGLILNDAENLNDIEKVPSYYYDWLIENKDEFNPSVEERKEAFADANIKVLDKLKMERVNSKEIANLFNATSEVFNETVRIKAVVLAQKTIVFNYLKSLNPVT